MLKLALYGKGGIGKSTMTANLSAAFSKLGKRVIQVGCDPKADSTINLLGGKPLMPVMDYLRTHEEPPERLDQIAREGYGGVLCIETGGPTPGLGCAGRGIIATFGILAVVIVSSGEKMALYAANNIYTAVKNFEDRSYAQVLGILLNHRNVPGETEKVSAFAQERGLSIVGEIPRSNDILRFEEEGKTVIEGDPELPISKTFLALAEKLLREGKTV